MSFNFYAGKIEGQPFVAAQTFIPSEQYRAGMVVDTLTPLPGSRVPKFTESGWLFRTIAPDLSLQQAEAIVSSVGGNVRTVGEVEREDVAKFIAPQILDKVLEPHQFESETPES